MSGGPDQETLTRARRWCAREFAKRYERTSHASHLADEILKEADAKFALDSHGVEGWCDGVGNEGVSYLNMDDTYTLTLVCETSNRSARFSVNSWGNIAERPKWAERNG